MHTFIVKVLMFTLALISFHLSAAAQDVNTVIAKQQTSNLEIALSGSVQAFNDAQLTSLESGVVKSIYVDAGDKVKAGQVLLSLDDSLAKIQLDQAKAVYQSAKVKYNEDLRLLNEISQLTKQEVVAKTLVSQRQSNLANSEALLTQAKATVRLQQEIVKRHQLLAPFAGTIAKRNVDIGEWVSQQSQVLQLVSDNNLRLFINIPQEYYQAIKNTTSIPAIVTPDVTSQKPLSLSLAQYINVSNPTSRTFRARIDLPQSTELVAGMSANVKVSIPRANASQVNLPKSALKRHADNSYSVYAVENGKAKRIGVKLLKTDLDTVVVQGVPDKSNIIVSGNDLLTEGTQVNVLTSTSEGKY